MHSSKATTLLLLLALACQPTTAQDAAASQALFESTQGQQVSLADHAGQVVVLNVWAIWCGPCITEIPQLVELQRRIAPHGATVIGLAVDSGSVHQVLGFWSRRLELEPSYPLWLASMQDAQLHFGARTVPLTLLIDRNGQVRERLLGVHDAETLLEKLQPLLQPDAGA